MIDIQKAMEATGQEENEVVEEKERGSECIAQMGCKGVCIDLSPLDAMVKGEGREGGSEEGGNGSQVLYYCAVSAVTVPS